MGARENDRCSLITSTTGGVMTDEAGAVTGELEVSIRLNAEIFDVSVRYAGSDEWYTITGSPVPLEAVHPTLADLHECVVEHLKKPGAIVDGNEEPTSLRGFSPV